MSEFFVARRLAFVGSCPVGERVRPSCVPLPIPLGAQKTAAVAGYTPESEAGDAISWEALPELVVGAKAAPYWLRNTSGEAQMPRYYVIEGLFDRQAVVDRHAELAVLLAALPTAVRPPPPPRTPAEVWAAMGTEKQAAYRERHEAGRAVGLARREERRKQRTEQGTEKGKLWRKPKRIPERRLSRISRGIRQSG